jgi:ABC-type multidrug transport system ATPase subunit
MLCFLLLLSVCKDTVIGNALLRGVSGGQRKRVTTAEFLMGGTTVMALDEISTGLDSATTFSISQHLCEACRVQKSTYVISLLQPPPETVNLFDDIILFAEGRLIYHGPRENILDFFLTLGFSCPVRKDMASFLQEVTTVVGQHEYASPELRARKVFFSPCQPTLNSKSECMV